MRETFAFLDDALITRLFQPAVDLVAHRLGQSRGAAVCCCLDLASLAWITSRAGGLSDAVTAGSLAPACLDVSLLLLGLFALISLRTLFRRTAGRSGSALRPAMLMHRGTVLLMLAAGLLQLRTPGLAETADVVMLVFVTCALYLAVCAEPPRASRGLPRFATAG